MIGQEAEYRILGRMLRDAANQEKYSTIEDIVRQIALTGCRRSEMIGLKWTEADTESSCLQLEDSKEGESIGAIFGLLSIFDGLPRLTSGGWRAIPLIWVKLEHARHC